MYAYDPLQIRSLRIREIAWDETVRMQQAEIWTQLCRTLQLKLVTIIYVPSEEETVMQAMPT